MEQDEFGGCGLWCGPKRDLYPDQLGFQHIYGRIWFSSQLRSILTTTHVHRANDDDEEDLMIITFHLKSFFLSSPVIST